MVTVISVYFLGKYRTLAADDWRDPWSLNLYIPAVVMFNAVLQDRISAWLLLLSRWGKVTSDWFRVPFFSCVVVGTSFSWPRTVCGYP